jgi:signal transduction histidine kinase
MEPGTVDHPRRVRALEALLQITSGDLAGALTHASDEVSAAFGADKVDAFVLDSRRNSLVALGTSNQPLSVLERQVGLDVLPIANGGRAVQVFQDGTFASGEVDRDPEELIGIRQTLKVKSQIGVPLEIGGTRRGVLLITSLRPDFFNSGDVRFAESVARWVGVLAHRAELTETIGKNAVEQGRRLAAEELITILAHDLRNYLNPMSIRLSIVCSRAERERREADVRDLTQAQASLRRLSDLITDILDVTKLERGVFSMRPETVNLPVLVRDVASAMSTAEQPIVAKAAEELTVAGDPARLKQCLENLLGNAIKHSPKRAAVEVIVRSELVDTKPMARVEIVDSGPGVAPDLLPHLFDRFVAGGTQKGLGLGLYIAKQIAVLHEGELTLESELGKGTKVTLMLPAAVTG